MAVLGSNRPHASITDTRIMLVADRELILKELERETWTPDQRIDLLKQLRAIDENLTHMQIISAKKWKIRRLNAKANKVNKGQGSHGGRKKRMHDSQGQPLYNGVEPLEQEPEDLKMRFLTGLKGTGKVDESIEVAEAAETE